MEKSGKITLDIALDMDGPIVDLGPYWIDEINKAHGDNIKDEEVTHWGMHEFAKRGKEIYKFFDDPEFWINAPPMPGIKDSILRLQRMGHNVFMATTAPAPAMSPKIHWIKKHLPMMDTDKHVWMMGEKGYLSVDILLDDGFHNIKSFHDVAKKQGIVRLPVLMRTYRTKHLKDIPKEVKILDSLPDFVDMIEYMEKTVASTRLPISKKQLLTKREYGGIL